MHDYGTLPNFDMFRKIHWRLKYQGYVADLKSRRGLRIPTKIALIIRDGHTKNIERLNATKTFEIVKKETAKS